MGCIGFVVVVVGLPILGYFAWASFQPKDVGYDDVLTVANVKTFATHNKWSSDWFEQDNTKYLQAAISHLGDKAYGRKLGDLMDWEKHRENVQNAKANPAPTPRSMAAQRADSRSQMRAYLQPLCVKIRNAKTYVYRMISAVNSGDAVAASDAVQSASTELDSAQHLAFGDHTDAQNLMEVGISDMKDSSNLVRQYLDDGRPSTMVDANHTLARGAQEVSVAYLSMAAEYKQLGGSPNDLCTF